MPQQTRQGNGVPLALKRAESRARGTLKVQSNSIQGAIPAMHSEYAEGLSPEISWSRVEGAKSYALIVEDPDAHAVRPFVHWVAWNIPGDVTTLPDGFNDAGALTETIGLLQGKTSKGSVGYFGPRPPEGDPPHHYHFQVFALDTELNLPPGAGRDEVLHAMSGHVLAAGELVGTYEQKATG